MIYKPGGERKPETIHHLSNRHLRKNRATKLFIALLALILRLVSDSGLDISSFRVGKSIFTTRQKRKA
jgi:hypothetical protein